MTDQPADRSVPLPAVRRAAWGLVRAAVENVGSLVAMTAENSTTTEQPFFDGFVAGLRTAGNSETPDLVGAVKAAEPDETTIGRELGASIAGHAAEQMYAALRALAVDDDRSLVHTLAREMILAWDAIQEESAE